MGFSHWKDSESKLDTDLDLFKDLLILDLTPKTKYEDLMNHMKNSHGRRVFPHLLIRTLYRLVETRETHDEDAASRQMGLATTN